ncbi:hypothetical protein ATO4_01810 [Aurantimonas sp. 22II-16-19i]|nr:hypothetical protein ATO4_01810 [Aurantimonas sp. 22II-16-19i]
MGSRGMFFSNGSAEFIEQDRVSEALLLDSRHGPYSVHTSQEVPPRQYLAIEIGDAGGGEKEGSSPNASSFSGPVPRIQGSSGALRFSCRRRLQLQKAEAGISRRLPLDSRDGARE